MDVCGGVGVCIFSNAACKTKNMLDERVARWNMTMISSSCKIFFFFFNSPILGSDLRSLIFRSVRVATEIICKKKFIVLKIFIIKDNILKD